MTKSFSQGPARLAQAVAPVLREVATRRPGMAFQLEVSSHDEHETRGMLWEPDGSGTGIALPPWHESDEESIEELADAVQELVQEASPAQGWSSSWPRCLEHGDAHPASPGLVDGDAVWTCPRLADGRVTPIGRLESDR